MQDLNVEYKTIVMWNLSVLGLEPKCEGPRGGTSDPKATCPEDI